jgi:hypothetical protein
MFSSIYISEVCTYKHTNNTCIRGGAAVKGALKLQWLARRTITAFLSGLSFHHLPFSLQFPILYNEDVLKILVKCDCSISHLVRPAKIGSRLNYLVVTFVLVSGQCSSSNVTFVPFLQNSILVFYDRKSYPIDPPPVGFFYSEYFIRSSDQILRIWGGHGTSLCQSFLRYLC